MGGTPVHRHSLLPRFLNPVGLGVTLKRKYEVCLGIRIFLPRIPISYSPWGAPIHLPRGLNGEVVRRQHFLFPKTKLKKMSIKLYKNVRHGALGSSIRLCAQAPSKVSIRQIDLRQISLSIYPKLLLANIS